MIKENKTNGAAKRRKRRERKNEIESERERYKKRTINIESESAIGRNDLMQMQHIYTRSSQSYAYISCEICSKGSLPGTYHTCTLTRTFYNGMTFCIVSNKHGKLQKGKFRYSIISRKILHWFHSFFYENLQIWFFLRLIWIFFLINRLK